MSVIIYVFGNHSIANQDLAKHYCWCFSKDGKLPIPDTITSFKTHSLWTKAPPFTHFSPQSTPSTFDASSISDALCFQLPTPFHMFAQTEWRQGTQLQFIKFCQHLIAGASLTLPKPSQHVLKCFISLAKTSPEYFTEPDGYRPAFGDLGTSVFSTIWLAANKALGSHWVLKTNPSKRPPYLTKSSPSPSTKVHFALPPDTEAGKAK